MPGERPGNQERIKEIMAQIENGIQDLFQSGRLESYLKAMSKFHRYSLNNTILIFLQCPTATFCAGYKTWKNEFGRYVKRGEKGIKILAPYSFQKTVSVMKLDPVTHMPIRDAGGQIVKEQQTIRVPRFRTVAVFDIAQTDGPPIPTLTAELTGDVQQYEVFMEAVRRASPVPIEIAPVQRDVDGLFNRENQRITIREGMGQVQTVCAAIHELAHALLHSGEQAKGKSNAVKEVEAECCAMAVSSFYGLDTSANSIPYLGTWCSDRSLPELRDSLQIIMDTTDRLITDIDRHFAAVCAERGIAVPDRLETRISHAPAHSEDAYPMPDTSILADSLSAAGYYGSDLLPLSVNRACELVEQDLSVYMVLPGQAPSMVFDREDVLEQPAGTVFAVPREEWENSAEFQRMSVRCDENRDTGRNRQRRPVRKKNAGKER